MKIPLAGKIIISKYFFSYKDATSFGIIEKAENEEI